MSELNRPKDLLRYSRMRKTVYMSVAAKLVRMISQIVLVGGSVRYLGSEQYGIWMTVMAALGWISFGQFGIGPGLINKLAEADGKQEHHNAGIFFTSALLLMITFAGTIFLLFALLGTVIDFSKFMHLSGSESAGEVNRLVLICAGLFLLRFPLSLLESLFIAYQQAYLIRKWEIAGQVLSIATLWILIFQKASLSMLVLGVSLASELMIFCGGIQYIVYHKPDLIPTWRKFNLKTGGEILHVGAGFFFIQIAGYLTTQGGILVMAHYHGPSSVTPYSVTWQLCMMASGVWMMFANALWGALGEAKGADDWSWIQAVQQKLVFGTMAYSFVFSLLLVVTGRFVIQLWSGHDAVPSLSELVAIAVFSSVFSWSVVNAQILNGLNVVWRQVIPSLLNGVLTVGICMLLVPAFGLIGLALSLILATLFSTAWYNPLLLSKELKHHVKIT